MHYLQFNVRDDIDKEKFFSHKDVVQVINFPAVEECGHFQALCKIGNAEHVIICFWGKYARVSFLGPIFPGDLEDVATCIENAGGRLFDGLRRVRGRKEGLGTTKALNSSK